VIIFNPAIENFKYAKSFLVILDSQVSAIIRLSFHCKVSLDPHHHCTFHYQFSFNFLEIFFIMQFHLFIQYLIQ